MSFEHVTVGFIGVGAISEATVTGLVTGPHSDRIDVVLSPRSASRSGALAAQFPQVTVAASNQAVVDAADIVMIGVLQDQVPGVCRELSVRPDQIVVGLAAGWAPSQLAPLVAPAREVCQLVPLPMIAHHTGPIVLYPASRLVEQLFTGCGDVVTLDEEASIPVLSVASATMSSFFALQRAASRWIVEQGISPDAATEYMTALFAGLATESVGLRARHGAGAITSADVVTEHETPGGLNQSVRETLERAGMFTELTDHYDEILTRVRG